MRKPGQKIGCRFENNRNSSSRTDAAIKLRRSGHGYQTIATLLGYADQRSAQNAVCDGIETRAAQASARSRNAARLSLIRKTLAKMKAEGRIITPIDEVIL